MLARHATLLGAALLVGILLLPATSALAETEGPSAVWLDRPDDWQPSRLPPIDLAEYRTEAGVELSGGVYWHLLPVRFETAHQGVLDFRNSSVIGRFQHWVIDASGEVVARFDGGIQSDTPNPYALRHGRPFELPAGDYQIITRLESPFYLAQPEPTLFETDYYQRSIKVGNAVTLTGIGIFFALGIYYIVLGTSRGRWGDLLYAAFITGNLLYNGAALLVFSDLLGIKQFYLISVPILFSNVAYIAFVMVLLNINRQSSPTLFRIGCGIIALFMSFWLVALVQPNWSLELDRIGVGIFALFGFTAGIVRILQGNRTARYYLIANAAFVVPALIAIGASTLPVADTLFIEHIGLFAVATEVILLSLVISHQVGMVYREKEAGLLATQEALMAANHALETKERFLANVSHELRTPLNAIQGSVELIAQYPLPTRVGRHVEAIHASSNFLLYLINDILDLAKMNADQLTLVHEPFDLDEAIDDLCSIYKNAYDRDRVRLLVDIDPAVPARLVGDENRLKQVLANLLSNAFKFTEQGEVVLSIRPDGDDHLTFQVTDTGIGIDADKLHTVFSAFTQADASIARKYGGTGLGLQIASKLVRLMGGDLRVNSQLGRGSEFHFSLAIESLPARSNPTARPVSLIYQDAELARLLTQDLLRHGIEPRHSLSFQTALDEDLPESEQWLVIANEFDERLQARLDGHDRVYWLVNRLGVIEDPTEQPFDIELLPYARAGLERLFTRDSAEQDAPERQHSLHSLQVVAVDDNVVNLKVLTSMLRRLGVDCTGFERAEAAVTFIGEHNPDMVLMDVQMPIIDGLEATRHLRQRSFANPVIAFTANASDQDLTECLSAGMNDILVKPIRLADLEQTLLKWSQRLADKG